MSIASSARSTDPRKTRSVLARYVSRAVVAMTPLAAIACGTVDGSTGVTDDGHFAPEGGCGSPPVYGEITFALCADLGDADADVDGGTDATVADAEVADTGDASLDSGLPGEPARCYVSCAAACAAAGLGGRDVGCSKQPNGLATAQCPTAPGHPCGRRVDGLVELSRDALASSALGAHFAECAWLEAASVHAFRRLARELRAAGAPDRLVSAAKKAMRDEIRHARAMGHLARRFGARVPPVVIEHIGLRTLEAIAVENAVEACVGETFGAAVAAWQAANARDVEVRTTLETIAREELDHAALGWAVAAWIDRRLDVAARARVFAARHAAVAALAARSAAGVDASCVATAGVPGPTDASRLLHSLREVLEAA